MGFVCESWMTRLSFGASCGGSGSFKLLASERNNHREINETPELCNDEFANQKWNHPVNIAATQSSRSD